MKNKTRLSIALALVAGMGLAACDEDNTQPGKGKVIKVKEAFTLNELDKGVLPKALRGVDSLLKREIALGALSQDIATRIMAEARKLAERKPAKLQSDLWRNRPIHSVIGVYREKGYRDSLINNLSPTLAVWFSALEMKNGCTVDKAVQDLIEAEKLSAYSCEGNKISLIAFRKNAAGIKKSYDFSEEAAFYQKDGYKDEDGLAALPFTEIDARQVFAVRRLKEGLETVMQTSLETRTKSFAPLWPKIQDEMARWDTPATGARDKVLDP